MVDEELSAALAAYRDAWEQYQKQPPHKPAALVTDGAAQQLSAGVR